MIDSKSWLFNYSLSAFLKQRLALFLRGLRVSHLRMLFVDFQRTAESIYI